MSDPATNGHAEDPLAQSAGLRAARRRLWMRGSEPSVARRLAQIGVLGWIVVVPTLIAMFAGRYIDTTFGSGIFWTGALLVVGLSLGCWSAWRWMHSK